MPEANFRFPVSQNQIFVVLWLCYSWGVSFPVRDDHWNKINMFYHQKNILLFLKISQALKMLKLRSEIQRLFWNWSPIYTPRNWKWSAVTKSPTTCSASPNFVSFQDRAWSPFLVETVHNCNEVVNGCRHLTSGIRDILVELNGESYNQISDTNFSAIKICEPAET